MPTEEQEQKVRQAASMRYWWPKLKQCDVATLDTTVINIRDWEEATEFQEGISVPDPEPIVELDM